MKEPAINVHLSGQFQMNSEQVEEAQKISQDIVKLLAKRRPAPAIAASAMIAVIADIATGFQPDPKRAIKMFEDLSSAFAGVMNKTWGN